MKKCFTFLLSCLMAGFVFAQEEQATDVTNLVTNADFESGTDGWSGDFGVNPSSSAPSSYPGFDGLQFLEKWVAGPGTLSDISCYQTVMVPNGVYVLTAYAIATQQSDGDLTVTGVSIYANEDTVPVATASGKPQLFKVMTEVKSGGITIGMRTRGCTANWIGWDALKLYHFADKTLDEVKYIYARAAIDAYLAASDTLLEGTIEASLKSQLQTAVGAAAAATTTETALALQATFAALIPQVEASYAAYAALTQVIEAAENDYTDGWNEAEVLRAAIDKAIGVVNAATASVTDVLAEVAALSETYLSIKGKNVIEGESMDFTNRLTNPELHTAFDGWTYTTDAEGKGFEHNVCEFYNGDFNIYQTLKVPNGKYVVSVSAFYREAGNDSGAAYGAGTENITAELYANGQSVKLMSLYAHTATEMGITDDVSNDYVNMRNSTNQAFSKGYYGENAVEVIVFNDTLTIGLRNSGHQSYSWCPFRDFKLTYYGYFPGTMLYALMDQIDQFLIDNEAVLLPGIAAELGDARVEYQEYADLDDADEISWAYGELNQIFLNAKASVELVKKLTDYAAQIEALAELDYPGKKAMMDVYDQAIALVDGTVDATFESLQNMIVALEKAIIDYKWTQVATREAPADYTFIIQLPNFAEAKSYTIPAPWVVANVATSGDVWVGPCRPSQESDGANIPGFNCWSDNFTSMNIYQEFTDVPNGLYAVKTRAITETNYEYDQHAYVTSSVATAVSPALDNAGWDSNLWTTLETEKAVVIDGKLRIGFASTHNAASGYGQAGWFQVTDFQLFYYGPASDEDMAKAWETSLKNAEEVVSGLLKGDGTALQTTIDEAKALAAQGKYVDACTLINPRVAEFQETFQTCKTFYAGNYQKLVDMMQTAGEAPMAILDQAITLADAVLKSDSATVAVLPTLDAKLGGYVTYMNYYFEVEALVQSATGYSAKYVTIVTDLMAAQAVELKAYLRSASACTSLKDQLQKAVAAMEKSTLFTLTSGDVTSLLANPTIDDSNATGWTVVKGTGNGPTITGQHYTGNTDERYIDSWNGVVGKLNFTAYQTLQDIPNGTYKLDVAARSDGKNVYLFAAPDSIKASTTLFEVIRNYADLGGEMWLADSLLWENENIVTDIYNAHNGDGYGWSTHTIENIEVTNHTLTVGVSADSTLTSKPGFTGTWFSVDDWTLELVQKKGDAEWDIDTSIEEAPVHAVTIEVRDGLIISSDGKPVEVYAVDGKQMDANTRLGQGLYLVRHASKVWKVIVQ